MKKKIIYGICMMVLVALVTTSCKKEKEASFSAEIELLKPDFSERAYINPITFATFFEGNEQFKIYNINDDDWTKSKTAIYQVTQAGGGVTPLSGSGLGYNPNKYYAFCPARMAEDDLMEGNYQKFEILDHQPLFSNPTQPGQYMMTVSGTSLPLAGEATYEDPHFVMWHIFGILGFQFHCDPAVINNVAKYRKLESMTITDPNKYLSGTVTLKPHKIKREYLTEIMEAYKAGQEFANIDRYQSYVLSHTGEGLGYSATGEGHTITYDLTEAGGLQWNTYNDCTITIFVAMRPGVLGNGFNVSLDISQEGAGTKTVNLEFPADRTKVMEPGYPRGYVVNLTEQVDEAFAEE
jgi:hypothetical protein